MEQRKVTTFCVGDRVSINNNFLKCHHCTGIVLEICIDNDSVRVKFDENRTFFSERKLWVATEFIYLIDRAKTIWERLETQLSEAQQNV